MGGKVAEEATKSDVQSVVEPLQLDMEEIINHKLLESEVYECKFKNVDLRDYDKLVERLIKEVGYAIKTPNEARNELGLKPYDGGDKFYIASSLLHIGEPNTGDELSKLEREFLDGN